MAALRSAQVKRCRLLAWRTEWKFPMKRLKISAFAVIALLAAATTMLRSHSPSAGSSAESAGTMSLQGFHTATDVNKLPIENFEDQSLVYSKAAK